MCGYHSPLSSVLKRCLNLRMMITKIAVASRVPKKSWKNVSTKGMVKDMRMDAVHIKEQYIVGIIQRKARRFKLNLLSHNIFRRASLRVTQAITLARFVKSNESKKNRVGISMPMVSRYKK